MPEVPELPPRGDLGRRVAERQPEDVGAARRGRHILPHGHLDRGDHDLDRSIVERHGIDTTGVPEEPSGQLRNPAGWLIRVARIGPPQKEIPACIPGQLQTR